MHLFYAPAVLVIGYLNNMCTMIYVDTFYAPNYRRLEQSAG